MGKWSHNSPLSFKRVSQFSVSSQSFKGAECIKITCPIRVIPQDWPLLITAFVLYIGQVQILPHSKDWFFKNQNWISHRLGGLATPLRSFSFAIQIRAWLVSQDFSYSKVLKRRTNAIFSLKLTFMTVSEHIRKTWNNKWTIGLRLSFYLVLSTALSPRHDGAEKAVELNKKYFLS